ncbi:uncharacterized protein BO87DRAFT_2511 [Aspergillus neoniger CBS 115656]|uniref:Uncharacterized protein n=1 Tax=Aspergillus neoniger (strain CBS 115656) TaxID=1448310 RepID=A0A318YXD4_ASPNB|nr:hypothetical protein BO87DRAFT_2511 [Aspergillus neoniger CBS 115656]PYH39575.1 hypothetical protein BO87DRAFT_2511 [Aspergillus neoniger CBS 115656]
MLPNIIPKCSGLTPCRRRFSAPNEPNFLDDEQTRYSCYDTKTRLRCRCPQL